MAIPIPEDARFELTALRESLTEQDYLDHIWKLRYPGRKARARGRWPIGAEAQPSNVTQLPPRLSLMTARNAPTS